MNMYHSDLHATLVHMIVDRDQKRVAYRDQARKLVIREYIDDLS